MKEIKSLNNNLWLMLGITGMIGLIYKTFIYWYLVAADSQFLEFCDNINKAFYLIILIISFGMVLNYSYKIAYVKNMIKNSMMLVITSLVPFVYQQLNIYLPPMSM